MPDHRRRGEANRPAAIEHPPAEIDVVTGNAKLRVEAADRVEARLRNAMLQPGMCSASRSRHEHVIGAAGRIGDAVGDPAGPGGRDIRAADRRHARS